MDGVLMRLAAKVDANQTQVVSALEAAGASVQSLAKLGRGCPDILVAFRGSNHVMEIKNPKGKNKVSDDQTKWHISWRAPVHIVRTPDEALRAIGAIA
jgi:hypothetical protein